MSEWVPGLACLSTEVTACRANFVLALSTPSVSMVLHVASSTLPRRALAPTQGMVMVVTHNHQISEDSDEQWDRMRGPQGQLEAQGRPALNNGGHIQYPRTSWASPSLCLVLETALSCVWT